VIVSSPAGRLLRREPDGSLVTHADLGETGWNDIVVDGRGNAYVNRIGFNPMAAEEFTPGLVHLATPAGSVRQVADDIAFPNGMAVSPDNATLIVADSYRHHLVAVDIGADGGLSNRRVWAGLGDGTPDGILRRRTNRCLVRRRPQPPVCARHRGWRGVTDRRTGPRLLRVRTGRPGRNNPVVLAADWRGMTEPEPVSPGTGQVLTIQVDVPAAGWP
jgi:sugar lactone lactonase YvrE